MSRKISLSVFIFVLLAAVLLSFLSAFVVVSQVYDAQLREAYESVGGGSHGSSGGSSSVSATFAELELLDDIFGAYSIFELDDDALLEAVLKAYVSTTGDRYAEYYTAEEFAEMRAQSAGDMEGIGVNIIQNTEYDCIEIYNVVPDSPAKLAGVEPGDLIVYVGIGDARESVSSLGYQNAVQCLKGEAGTRAEFVVRRGENYAEELEFSIERGPYTNVTVMSHVCATDPDVGIVKITQFDLPTPAQFCEAVDSLRDAGIEKFIFDLRYNPGGDLQSILAVLSYFLNEGDVVIGTEDNEGNREELKVAVSSLGGDYAGCSVSADDIGKYRGLSCAVLVNGNTASAAELFTSNFRDYGLGKIVGTTTYGKGTMQSIFSLDRYGYEGGIKLTTKRYFPPCGESYDGIGIVPDIEIELSEAAKAINVYKLADADDDQLQRAIQEIK